MRSTLFLTGWTRNRHVFSWNHASYGTWIISHMQAKMTILRWMEIGLLYYARHTNCLCCCFKWYQHYGIFVLVEVCIGGCDYSMDDSCSRPKNTIFWQVCGYSEIWKKLRRRIWNTLWGNTLQLRNRTHPQTPSSTMIWFWRASPPYIFMLIERKKIWWEFSL